MMHWIDNALDPVLASCSPECMQFWQVVGIWFSGVATSMAVIVALLLARRDRVRLSISAQHHAQVSDTEQYSPDLLLFTIRNLGHRPATVDSIVWRPRPWLRTRVIQLFPFGYAEPPVTIPANDSAIFRLPINEPPEYWADNFARSFFPGKLPLGLRIRLIRAEVYTSTGDVFKVSIEPSLHQWLLHRATELEIE
jgi:hypothetical protein